MKVDKETIEYVANLARLRLSEKKRKACFRPGKYYILCG